MPRWVIPFLMPFATIALKFSLRAFEKKYPGLSPVIDKVIGLIDEGAHPIAVEKHLDNFSVVTVTPSVKSDT